MDLPFDPVIPLLGIYPKEFRTLIQKNISTPTFIAALFTISRMWKQPKCPSVDEWVTQLSDIDTMEYNSSVKNSKVLPFVKIWMNLEKIMQNEISQLAKDKYCDSTHMWNLMNELD